MLQITLFKTNKLEKLQYLATVPGSYPALLEGVVDNCTLDVLDCHRRLVDAEHAGALAGGRAHSSGEF